MQTQAKPTLIYTCRSPRYDIYEHRAPDGKAFYRNCAWITRGGGLCGEYETLEESLKVAREYIASVSFGKRDPMRVLKPVATA